MSSTRDRSSQKRRTRRAILEAAVQLMRRDGTISPTTVAEAAEVSRGTVYQYFPTQEQLLTETVLEALRPGIEGTIAGPGSSSPAAARVDALVDALWTSMERQEALFRTMVRLTVVRTGDPKERVPSRGYRRIDFIEQALAPVRGQLIEEEFNELVSGLAMVIGIEAMLVLRDIRGLSWAEARAASRWAAHALLQAVVKESPHGGRPEASRGVETL